MKIFGSVALITVLILTGTIQSHADDIDLFLAQIPPDALIVLDLSGSMRWTAVGGTMYISSTEFCGSDVTYYPKSATGHTKACNIDPYDPVPKYGDPSCSGPFYITSRTGYSTDCGRLAIAKRSIFDLLDDNQDYTIDTRDETSLGIRLGYMRFYNCISNDTGGSFSSGCNTLRNGINEIGSNNYSQIWSLVNAENASGGTPVVSSLNEARLYFNQHKISDPGKECRKKFVILITDGSDTYTCSGTGSEDQTTQYKRRRETVAIAKALSDAGYKVFVVGFGADMPHHLKNTLNWIAYFGGTDNPLDVNLGDTKQYNIPSGSLYPSGVTSCQSSSYTSHNLGDGAHYYATSNDPGELSLSGYAFFAENASQLSMALKTIKNYIQEKSSSYTGSAVPSVRFVDKDIVYTSSLEIPSWKGDLKAYQLNENGTLPIDEITKQITVSPIWDAGEKLNQKNPGDRKIYTYLGGADKEDFKSSNPNLTKEALGMPDDINREKIINHVRGIDAYDLNMNGNTTEPREWKLGDIFHSNAVIVGEPSRFFVDEGFSGTGGFYQANKDRTKVVIVGANDGMLHAFNASTGVEEWGFIPNSLLKNLQSMVSTHTYYVDSSPKVVDVWFDLDGNNQKSCRTPYTPDTCEWKTVLICGLRKGGKTYFALDITETLNPKYLWEFPKSTDLVTLAKVGQSWSEPPIGRVKVEVGGKLYERWVAFIGGGFDYTNNTGKAFFVIDIKTGDIIKEFSGIEGMNYSFAAPPTAVDTNLDGFIDKIYIGDLGGQMWVFDVSFDGTNKKSNSKWTGKRLFIAPSSDTEKHRIYYQPAVAFDRYGTPWIYFGTGDREHPKDLSNPAERFYGVKDNGKGNYPRSETDLLDVTSSNTFTPTSKDGWYLRLEKSTQTLEKVLAKPVVFNKLVYFTTYAYTATANPCSVPDAKLYIVEYLSGGGALEVDDLSDLEGSPSQRSKTIGTGAPSNPVITVNVKGKASVTIGTTSGQVFSTQIFSPSKSKEILYWREVIP